MPLTGTLRSWNDDPGFGFIAPTHGGAEIFVHVSAFPRDQSKPTVGEKLTYELERGRDGRPQAVKVVRQAVGSSSLRRVASRRGGASKTSWLGTLILVGIVVIGGAWGYKQFASRQSRMQLSAQPAATTADLPTRSSPTSAFVCDGRTHCSQMTSCAEATWFINHCPGTQMDGNNDGVPCESQWCN
jgi:cold shock CspA family protein